MTKPQKKPIPQGLAKVFGQRARDLRIANTGLSQEDFADHIGVHRTVISRIERGETNITFANIFLICMGLNVKLSEFFLDFENSIPNAKDTRDS
jgi:transcriptional regulator with XRE-family HTH domain